MAGARTPIGKAYRGALNATYGATLGAHAVAATVERAGLERSEVEDVIVGGSLSEGTTRENIARHMTEADESLAGIAEWLQVHGPAAPGP